MPRLRTSLAVLLLPQLLPTAAALEPVEGVAACGEEDDASPECSAASGRALLQREVRQLSGLASEEHHLAVQVEAAAADCEDDADFVDARGYGCISWAGRDCHETPFEYSEANMKRIRDLCPKACQECAPAGCSDHVNFTDKHGYSCKAWGGHDCHHCSTCRVAALYNRHDLEAVRDGCPATCHTCPPTQAPTPAPTPKPTQKPKCPDSPTFKDSHGFNCSEWTDRDCNHYRHFGWYYKHDEREQIKKACPRACGLCHP